MEARAEAKYLRLSPRKVQLVVRMIRGRPVKEAEAMLRFTSSRAARAVEKVLKSAGGNAEDNLGLDRRTLKVSRGYADEGPSTKRGHPRAPRRGGSLTR